MTRLTPHQQHRANILAALADGEWHDDPAQRTPSAARNYAWRVNTGRSAFPPGVEARTRGGVVQLRLHTGNPDLGTTDDDWSAA
ncbi:MAG: hypothetical protein L0L18_00980 [Acidipropionibacterium jensenii]|nr:hypothetical protein [Acidipropionibacterium jensenii]